MKAKLLNALGSLRAGIGPAALPRKPISDNPFLLDHLRKQRQAGMIKSNWERRFPR